MLSTLVLFAIIFIILFILFGPKQYKESFSNGEQYVLPTSDPDSVDYTLSPDESWLSFEKKMKQQMVSSDTDGKTTSDDEKTTSDDEKTTKETDTKQTPNLSEENSGSSLFKQEDRERGLKTDQIYLMQKQKSAPRCLPKFSKKQFLVYEPKTPPLHYETRPGPNSFHDPLSERAHVETKKELRDSREAQRSAQERHEELLRRSNWIFDHANKISPDHILHQPKMIPGPYNTDKYVRRYTHYGIAA